MTASDQSQSPFTAHLSFAAILRVIRPHQWLKNALIAVPAIAAHHFDATSLFFVGMAFLSFSLCASSVYILNDYLDREHDRLHPRKKLRPFASGALPERSVYLLVPLFLIASGLAAFKIPQYFFYVLGGYFVLTLIYTLYAKRMMMVDVVILAVLYGLRVGAGGAALAIPLSEWLIAFCVFFFLSLALIKRAAELRQIITSQQSEISGRGYRAEDYQSVQALAGASGFVSVLVISLYFNSDAVRSLYNAPYFLWGTGLVMLFWLGRILILTARGEMHDDPVVFAITDRVSLISGGFIAIFLGLSML
jgi:4-hydroxybenzoate polyprenyltransferase